MARKASGGELIVVGRNRAQLREASPQTITDEQIEIFFSELAETCNVVRSAKAAGFTANWAYRKRKMDAGFRAGWAAAYGSSRIAAVQPLVDQFAVPLFDDGTRLRTPAGGVKAPDADDLGCGAGTEGSPGNDRVQMPARELPGTLALSYYDPARDYQAGQLRASSAAA